MTDPLKALKEQYNHISIPKELENMITQTLQQDRLRQRRIRIRNTCLSAACVCALFVGSINLSPAVHQALAEVPVLGALVEVCTFRGYDISQDNFEANISIPQVAGLDPEITAMLNQKYLAEGQALYEDFKADMDAIQTEFPDAHMGLDYSFTIKTNNDRIFSLGRVFLNTAGSSSNSLRYDTVDKKTQTLITLPSLFAPGADYITPISDQIKEQMRAQMAADDSIVYWLDDEMVPESNFQAINADQEFYINDQGQLVISFDEYAVAPGYMGSVEFTIPTSILQPILAQSSPLQ